MTRYELNFFLLSVVVLCMHNIKICKTDVTQNTAPIHAMCTVNIIHDTTYNVTIKTHVPMRRRQKPFLSLLLFFLCTYVRENYIPSTCSFFYYPVYILAFGTYCILIDGIGKTKFRRRKKVNRVWYTHTRFIAQSSSCIHR